MANAISQRRDSMNNIFITLNLALMAAISLTWDPKSLFLLVAGCVLCVLWEFFINNYRKLNEAKFLVIQSLEDKLPEAPFKDEWQYLKKKGKYLDSTLLEGIMPKLFIILYIIASGIILQQMPTLVL